MFTALPAAWQGVTTHSAATVLAFLLITFLHVVFGELIPKTMALQVPDRAALWLAQPLLVFGWLARPLTLLMNGTGNFAAPRPGLPARPAARPWSTPSRSCCC